MLPPLPILRPAHLLAGAVLLCALASPAWAGLPPTGVSFSKSFSPSTMGPGSVSTLTFEITNDNPQPETDLAFTDTLPAALTIAAPAFVSNTCGGTLTAPEGGSTITLSGGAVAAASSCQITVDVTGTTFGAHQNVSGDLTSSAGNSGPAVDTLTIDAGRPGFTKSFSPDPVQFGGTSTLTFTIDNGTNDSPASNLAFTDDLPSGLEITDPANTSNGCGGSLTAPGGGTTISLVSGLVGAGATCTISVDVTTTAAGRLDNRTSDLTSSAGNSGKASDSLTVEVDELALIKTFVDDPASPGGTTTLELSITNLNRSQTATDIEFTDDLEATLTGLVATGLPQTDVCGAGSTLSGTSLLSLTGGVLGPGETCTFQVTLQVPAAASPGSFPNTTSEVTGTVGGEEVTGAPATDTLVVDVFPVLTKTFTDDPVPPGGTVILEFTITNTSSTSGATDIEFTDDLETTVPGLVGTGLPLTDVCGAGSELAAFDPPGPAPPDPSLLTFTGGDLAPAGSPGDSCTFQVTLQLPADVPSGVYPNTTSEITATVDGTTRTGPPATDDLQVVAAPQLRKEFTDDPVQPGDTVTLQFTLIHPAEASGDATGIAFTDDLEAIPTLSGLQSLSGTLTDVCGTGSEISGSSTLSFSGGTLSPGESCTFSVTLQVPAGAPSGNHLNTTSPVQATVDGVATESPAATDLLSVAILTLTKEFVDDPVLPGATVTLRFRIDNLSPSADATDIQFTDDLDDTLSGLQTTGLPAPACGGTVSGTSTITFSGGSLAAGTFCTFDVTLQVPAGAASDTYPNVTADFSATVEGETVLFPNASDQLTVDDSLLLLTKEFTDDPVQPGDTVTLRFTVESLASETTTDIAFTDDLDAALTGLEATGLPIADPCGAGSLLAGDPDASNLSLTGGTLPAGGSCTFDVTLQVPAGAPVGTDAVNTTSSVTGTVGGLGVTGDPATDTLQVRAITFVKEFDGPTVAGGEPVLTFTLTNLDSGEGVSSLGFTDDLDAVLPGLVAAAPLPTDPCGAGSSLSGTSVLALSGGSLAAAGQPGDSCTFSVTLQVPSDAAPGDFPNTTSELVSAGLPVADPATDTLAVEPPPGFGKSFAPDALGVGQTSTLTFTIVNTTSAVDATDLAFADTLPAGVEVASPPNASITCIGGTITAAAGGGTVSYTGGSVAAGTSCTVQVDVTPTAPGTFLNTSGVLTSSSGSSGTASDSLEALAQALAFEKEFVGIATGGGTVELVFTLTNGFAEPATDISFTDDLDAVMPGMEAVGLPEPDVCGLGSQLSGTSVITLTGGVLPPGGSCSFSVTLQLPPQLPPPPYENLTSPVTFTVDGVPVEAAGAAAVLQVSVLEIPTATTWGLLLLASLLAAGALWRLRG